MLLLAFVKLLIQFRPTLPSIGAPTVLLKREAIVVFALLPEDAIAGSGGVVSCEGESL